MIRIFIALLLILPAFSSALTTVTSPVWPTAGFPTIASLISLPVLLFISSSISLHSIF
jgi:hypothetical protein